MGYLFTIVSSLTLAIAISTSTDVYIATASDSREIVAEVTAYTASVDETDSDPDIVASGKKTALGMAACPSWLEFGTKIKISGNEYVCEDRMSYRFRDGNYFDILMSSKKEALEWGRQTTKVLIY